MMRIKYVKDCVCGGVMSSVTLDLSQDPGEQIEVDLDMLGEMWIECPDCSRKAFVPDISDYIEDIE